MTTSQTPATPRRMAFEIDTAAFKAKPVAVIGYGSQGRAHALNMKESGCDVIVGVRPGGKGDKRAKADGLRTAPIPDAAREASVIAILTPDMSHEGIFRDQIAPNLNAGDAVLFAHGFTVHYGRIEAPDDVDIILVAPKGPGDLVRREFERGRGVPCLFAVHQDATGTARDRALSYTACIGGSTAGVIETTFAEETETDLFGEQAVLCGGATELVLAGYETLTEAGYQPEVAYFECMHELKLIVDLLYEGGLAKMHEFISETAIYGDLRSGPRVINSETKARMKEVLTDIQDGTFARDWIMENQAGKPQYNALLRKDLEHPIEKTGAELRAEMPWLQAGANT
ncbi:ketol-acid reductoisomerase [Maricaulis sp.]|uniref:ketol-acid reductoisomerase n=1 Tax=Maricaulis sp. TaxID=1486257 RepID=UPI003A9284B8